MPTARRTERVTARLRKRERALFEVAARAAGLHLSELMREAAIDRARSELAGLAEAEVRS